MKNHYFSLTLVLLFVSVSLFGQNVKVEGYIFAENNTGFLNDVTVGFFTPDSIFIESVKSDVEGKFEAELPAGKNYRVITTKKGFQKSETELSTVGKKTEETVYTKISMARAPGYIFEATLSELVGADHEGPIDALTECTIEIYNNTKKEEVLVLKNHPRHTFSFTFEKGNSYTLMIRKKGFFTKRLQANVDINDCILCFEGIGTIRPGVSDNLSAVGGHSAGVLGTDIKLKRIEIGEPIEVNNIYFDFGKWDITPLAEMELEKLAGILKDNPHLLIELGAHTDSRGFEDENYELSAKRARSTVDHLVFEGIDKNRMTAKGYGESTLKNKCKSKVPCSDEEHQVNRRTEFKVLGYTSKDPYEDKSLRQIIFDEQVDAMVAGYEENTVIMVPEDGKAPVNLERDKEGKVLPGQEGIVVVPPLPEGEEAKGVANDLLGGNTETVKIGSQEAEVVKPTLGKGQESITNPELEIIPDPIEDAVKPALGKGTSKATEIIEIVEDPEMPEPLEKVITATTRPATTSPAVVEIVEEIVPEIAEPVEKVITTTTQPATPNVDPIAGDVDLETAIAAQIANIEAEVEMEEAIEEGGADTVKEIDNSTPQVTKLDKSYTGFKIEILSSEEELPLTHAIFKEFGKIDVELNVDKKFHYLMGDFRNGNLAEAFLARSVKPRYSSAKVVHYQGGERFKID